MLINAIIIIMLTTCGRRDIPMSILITGSRVITGDTVTKVTSVSY
jgi:hypothetical protein